MTNCIRPDFAMLRHQRLYPVTRYVSAPTAILRNVGPCRKCSIYG
ncbi:hypothetical protein [Spirosoma flavus]